MENSKPLDFFETKDYNKITVNIALNYGGRAELVHSVKAIAEKIKNGEISVDDINEDLISQKNALFPHL